EHARILAVDVEADAPRLRGQAVRQFLPCLAGVDRLEHAAGRAAVGEAPRIAAPRPEGGVDVGGIGGVDNDVDGAGVLVDGEDVLPGLAAVAGLEDAALPIRAPQAPARRDV